jgi:hypothetical protein
MLDEDELLTRPYREKPVDRQVEDMVEEIHIPDYVVVDFGFPGGGRYSLDSLYPPRGLLR